MDRFEDLKDPEATREYQIDWSQWLGADTILTSVWIVPAGLSNAGDSNTTTAATIFVSGGTVGEVYELVNRITTAGGHATDRTIKILIVQK